MASSSSSNSTLKPPRRRATGRPFVKGRSGNPAGRPPGSRNRATVLAEQLLDGEAAALARKALEMALAGDPVALRLCLDRIIAPRRERPVPVALPALRNAGDLAPAVAAVAAGLISPAEARELSQMLETYQRVADAGEVERRRRRARPAAR